MVRGLLLQGCKVKVFLINSFSTNFGLEMTSNLQSRPSISVQEIGTTIVVIQLTPSILQMLAILVMDT